MPRVLVSDPQGRCSEFLQDFHRMVANTLKVMVGWRGEVFDGAPVVWSRCRTDVKRHQQWALPAADAADGSFRVQLRGSDATHGESLCVAAPSAAALSS